MKDYIILIHCSWFERVGYTKFQSDLTLSTLRILARKQQLQANLKEI